MGVSIKARISRSIFSPALVYVLWDIKDGILISIHFCPRHSLFC